MLFVIVMSAGMTTATAQISELPTISTDRPGQATTPGIMMPGYLQLEAGVQYAHDNTANITTTTLSTPAAVLRVGVLTRMELRLSAEAKRVTPDEGAATSGVGSIAIGTKVGITSEEGSLPEMALGVTLGLPIGSPGFHPANLAPSMLLAMRSGLSSSTNLYYNIGAAWDGSNGAGAGSYAIALWTAPAERLSLFGEIYGTLATGAVPIHAVDAGLSYLVAASLQLDLSGGAGISRNAPDYFINGGVSIRLPR